MTTVSTAEPTMQERKTIRPTHQTLTGIMILYSVTIMYHTAF